MWCDLRYARFWQYYWLAKKHRKNIDKEISKIGDPNRLLDERCELARSIAYHPFINASGYYSLACIENVFLEKSKEISVETEDEADSTSILHVMTTAYPVGGHTRVVERWIKDAPDTQKHSIVVLDQEEGVPIPTWLFEVVNDKAGEFVVFEKMNMYDRARRLSKMASRYGIVVLHVHMWDVTPLLAFGNEKFKRPVIFYNHADHLFWLGVSVSDIIADIRQSDFSVRIRHAHNIHFLGIPTDGIIKQELVSKEEKLAIRSELGIGAEEFVIVTTGEGFKYNDVGFISFIKLAQIIVDVTKAKFYLIGPSGKRWDRSCERSKNQLLPLGKISEKKLYYKYLHAADMYIGSFPMPGFTAQMDAIQCGLPVLSFQVSQQRDFLFTNLGYIGEGGCYTENDLIRKCKLFSESEYSRASLWKSQKHDLVIGMDVSWKNRLSDLYNKLPQRHSVRSFNNSAGDSNINDTIIVLAFLYCRKCFSQSLLFFNNSYVHFKYFIKYIRFVRRVPWHHFLSDLKFIRDSIFGRL